MNVVLIGLRGSGKTKVGKILAKQLGKRFIEMDKLIVKKAKMSIPKIVEKFGWDKFRDLEEQVATEVSKLKNVVNATGGGVILRKRNISNLKKNSIVIWLQARIDTLLKRIGDDPNRPSLTGNKNRRTDMQITFKERKSLYQKAADFIIDTENKGISQVAEEIIKLLKRKGVK